MKRPKNTLEGLPNDGTFQIRVGFEEQGKGIQH